ncbi:MAG: hypothetical protein DHS20C16_07770 [Phycisphaerae bacterium]|nr:MAG: hypothetical protein DHS20C16_07770 [Phycisphaerae bacterium]
MNSKSELYSCTSILCIGLMVFVSVNTTGCEPPTNSGPDSGGDSGSDGSNGSDEPIQVAKSNVRIGEFVVINHSSIKKGEARTVSFEQFDGFVREIEIIPHADGELSVPAIPTYSEGSELIPGGPFDISIDGVNGFAELDVENMYSLPNLEVGSIFRLFIESALADGEELLARLDGELDGIANSADEQRFRADLVENQDFLRGLLEQWDANGRMTLPFSDTETVEVNSTNMYDLERYLVSTILGAHAEIARRVPTATARLIGGDCIEQVNELSGDELQACMEQCIANVKDTAVRYSQVAGVLPTAVGVAFTLVGLFVTSKALILTGAVVAALGILHGFVTAYAANKNTDTYGQNDGEGFSASREAISQVGRYGSNLVSPVSSLAIAAKDLSSSLEAAKCDDGNPRQRIIISDDLIEFCEFVFVDGSQDSGPDTTLDDPECLFDTDCASDEVCENEACVPDTTVTETCEQTGCPDGEACIEGECGPCEIDDECPDGQICILNECIEGTDVGEGCEVTGCESGEVCCNSECIPFGIPTSGVCPGTFEMDFGVFSPSIHDVSMVEFELNAEGYSATCTYSRTDGTPGTYGLVLFYEPVGINPPSAGLCGEQDDDGDDIVAQNGYHSTVRTLSVVSVISGSVRIVDPDGVFGEMINNAAGANVGSECCDQ